MDRIRLSASRGAAAAALIATVVLGAGVWKTRSDAHAAREVGTDVLLADEAAAAAQAPAGPPWIYGAPDARFTLIEYSDLECPHCRAYFGVLKKWIEAHPEVKLQWHHLPLQMHEPAASTSARMVECVGEADGHAAFWRAVEWVYANTRGSGQGLADGQRYPELSLAAQHCMDSDRPDAVVRAQSAAAMQDGIKATPTLRLHDRQSNRTILLTGPVEGDSLLSALDMMASMEGGDAQ